MMESFSSLEQDVAVLSRQMVDLKLIKHQVATREGRDMDGWLEKVEGIEHKLDEIRKEFEILGKQSDVINLKVLGTLSQKVIENLNAVKILKDVGNSYIESSPVHSNKIEHKTFSHEDLIKFTSQFAKNIGSGGFSNVYKGQLDDGKQVAVKVLKSTVVIGDFVAEIQTVITTSHPNLVTLYGVCFDYNMKALVYKFMKNGSLEKVLFNDHLSLEWGKLYEIALETAKGLAYLHDGCGKDIIHRDIKPSNVLLDENLSPKITDFGLAKLISKDAKHYTITKNQGTPGYIAPEFGSPISRITKKCDVYSFGVMLFEILGKRCNGEFGPNWFPVQIWEKFKKGQLDELIVSFGIPEMHRGKAKILSMVAFWCAQHTVEIRPSMSVVVEVLEKEIPVNTPPHPFMHCQSPLDFSMLPSDEVILEIHSEASPVIRESVMKMLEMEIPVMDPPNPFPYAQLPSTSSSPKLSPRFNSEVSPSIDKRFDLMSIDNFMGLLRIRVIRGINLAVRGVFTRDPYVVLKLGKQKLKTCVVKKNVNPEWNEDLTFSVVDPNLPVKLIVYVQNTFSRDDKIGDAEFDIKTFIEACKINLASVPHGTIITKLMPSKQNCLAEESCIMWTNGKVVQDICARLKNAECGEVELQLQWIYLPGSKGI